MRKEFPWEKESAPSVASKFDDATSISCPLSLGSGFTGKESTGSGKFVFRANGPYRSRSPSPNQVAHAICTKIETSDGEEEDDEDMESPVSSPVHETEVDGETGHPTIGASPFSFLAVRLETTSIDDHPDATGDVLLPRSAQTANENSTTTIAVYLPSTTAAAQRDTFCSVQDSAISDPWAQDDFYGSKTVVLSRAADSTWLDRVGKRKRVRFADDLGHQLTEMRLLLEPSDVPPQLESQVVKDLIAEQMPRDYDCGSGGGFASWTLGFSQPASDYLSFRQKLDQQNVVLENVLLRNKIPCHMEGTVRVRNLAFEKQVFIRWTTNDWSSFRDTYAFYVSGIPGATNSDTFRFNVEIPADTEHPEKGQQLQERTPSSSRCQKIEFSVCFRANGSEFWDNNGGSNFAILSERAQKLRAVLEASSGNCGDHPSRMTPGARIQPPTAATDICCENWAQFSAWKSLTNTGGRYY
jgi:protein phosphatase 1 regulatory subunit 3A/B/C/D/E